MVELQPSKLATRVRFPPPALCLPKLTSSARASRELAPPRQLLRVVQLRGDLPCRRIDGVAGGRSTWGECLGVLTWAIEEGRADEVSLDGLAVALASRYHDDEPGSPWSYVMYLDARANTAQR